MCNQNCIKTMPKICWLFIALISFTVIGLITHGLVKLTQSVHEKSVEKISKLKETDEDSKNDYEMELHIRKHQATLEHNRISDEKKRQHELTKIGILVPASLVIVVVICAFGFAIFYLKCYKQMANNPNKTRTKNESLEEPNHGVASIPKRRLEDFNNLKNMGFDKIEAIEAINNSNSISVAIDYIASRKQLGSDKKVDSYAAEKDGKLGTKELGSKRSPDSEIIYL